MKIAARSLIREVHPDLDEADHQQTVRRELARRLRQTRKARGLTQAQIAERSGMTQSQISILEAPKGNMPGLTSIHRYMKACGALPLMT